MKLELNPQEVYLFEQITQVEFSKKMRDYYRLFLDALEELFALYMQNLPYDLRSKPLPYQADVVWGETVMPNLREIMQYSDEFYFKLKNGDMSYITGGAHGIGGARRGMNEYWGGWMDDLPNAKVKSCWDYFSLATQYASILRHTYPTDWEKGRVVELFNIRKNTMFQDVDLTLPESYPIYRINPNVRVKTGEPVPQTGIYICSQRGLLRFLATSLEKNTKVPNGFYFDKEQEKEVIYETEWLLVERVADSGGAAESIEVERLRALGGQICPRTGDWWSPANKMQSRHFKQGEKLPKLTFNPWGETVWYLQQTNAV